MKQGDFNKDATRKPHPYDVIVGANIRRIRIAQKRTQEALGKAIGCKCQQITKVEVAQNRISASKLALAAKFLDCDVSDFFEGVGDRKASARILASSDSNRNCLVVNAFNAIRDPKQQNAILNLMRTMAQAED